MWLRETPLTKVLHERCAKFDILLLAIFGSCAHIYFGVSCRVPSYDPYSVLSCLVLVPNKKTLFHLNSSCQLRARGICGLGQKQLFWVVAERPREGSFTVGGEEGYNVLIRLFPCSGTARFCVLSVLLGNRISVVPEYRSLWSCVV
jgi:hypothetical protein